MLEELVAWVIDNKQWLFSGAGLMVIVWMGRLIFKKSVSSSQTIRSGDSSASIQAGRDVSIGTTKRNDVE